MNIEEEKQIIEFISKGFRNIEIARELSFSHSAIKLKISQLLKKYKAKSRAHLVGLFLSGTVRL